MYKEPAKYGEYSVSISDEYQLMIVDESPIHEDMIVVRLASQDEANKALEELEDESGDSMHDEGAIFSKYPELHKFRP